MYMKMYRTRRSMPPFILDRELRLLHSPAISAAAPFRLAAMSSRGSRSSRAQVAHVGSLELNDARLGGSRGERYKFFHGTSWEGAQQIQREGFRPSADGCLGPGVYVARREKAERFARDLFQGAGAPRHGKYVGG